MLLGILTVSDRCSQGLMTDTAGRAGRQFVVAGNVETRWQQRHRRNLAGPLQLWYGKVNDRRVHTLRRVHESDGAIRSAKVNADDIGR